MPLMSVVTMGQTKADGAVESQVIVIPRQRPSRMSWWAPGKPKGPTQESNPDAPADAAARAAPANQRRGTRGIGTGRRCPISTQPKRPDAPVTAPVTAPATTTAPAPAPATQHQSCSQEEKEAQRRRGQPHVRTGVPMGIPMVPSSQRPGTSNPLRGKTAAGLNKEIAQPPSTPCSESEQLLDNVQGTYQERVMKTLKGTSDETSLGAPAVAVKNGPDTSGNDKLEKDVRAVSSIVVTKKDGPLHAAKTIDEEGQDKDNSQIITKRKEAVPFHDVIQNITQDVEGKSGAIAIVFNTKSDEDEIVETENRYEVTETVGDDNASKENNSNAEANTDGEEIIEEVSYSCQEEAGNMVEEIFSEEDSEDEEKNRVEISSTGYFKNSNTHEQQTSAVETCRAEITNAIEKYYGEQMNRKIRRHQDIKINLEEWMVALRDGRQGLIEDDDKIDVDRVVDIMTKERAMHAAKAIMEEYRRTKALAKARAKSIARTWAQVIAKDVRKKVEAVIKHNSAENLAYAAKTDLRTQVAQTELELVEESDEKIPEGRTKLQTKASVMSELENKRKIEFTTMPGNVNLHDDEDYNQSYALENRRDECVDCNLNTSTDRCTQCKLVNSNKHEKKMRRDKSGKQRKSKIVRKSDLKKVEKKVSRLESFLYEYDRSLEEAEAETRQFIERVGKEIRMRPRDLRRVKGGKFVIRMPEKATNTVPQTKENTCLSTLMGGRSVTESLRTQNMGKAISKMVKKQNSICETRLNPQSEKKPSKQSISFKKEAIGNGKTNSDMKYGMKERIHFDSGVLNKKDVECKMRAVTESSARIIATDNKAKVANEATMEHFSFTENANDKCIVKTTKSILKSENKPNTLPELGLRNKTNEMDLQNRFAFAELQTVQFGDGVGRGFEMHSQKNSKIWETKRDDNPFKMQPRSNNGFNVQKAVRPRYPKDERRWRMEEFSTDSDCTDKGHYCKNGSSHVKDKINGSQSRRCVMDTNTANGQDTVYSKVQISSNATSNKVNASLSNKDHSNNNNSSSFPVRMLQERMFPLARIDSFQNAPMIHDHVATVMSSRWSHPMEGDFAFTPNARGKTGLQSAMSTSSVPRCHSRHGDAFPMRKPLGKDWEMPKQRLRGVVKKKSDSKYRRIGAYLDKVPFPGHLIRFT